MAVDALVSIEYLAELEHNLVPYPAAVAISNNSYIMPPGHFGPLDSIGSASKPNGIAGLDLLFELTMLPSPLDRIDPRIVVGGGGIRRFDETLHWPFCDQQALSRIGHVLAPELLYEAPNPGDSLCVQDGSIDVLFKSIHKNSSHLDIEKARPPVFESVVTIQNSGRSDHECESLVLNELPGMAISLGMSLLAEYWWKSKHEAKFIVILVMLKKSNDPSPLVYGLKGLDGNFSRIEMDDIAKLAIEAPFGLIGYLQDFGAVIAGDVEIWDIAGKSIKCWHPIGHTLNNLASFLYAYFGEQVRPELASSCLAKMKK
ncbi:hypothetical protein [Duganella vulcania]|nr:hypothetical protein [Duganella vulcania]